LRWPVFGDVGPDVRPRIVAIALAPALAVMACVTERLTAGVPRAAEHLVIAPYAHHEECVPLAEGERLEWRYASSAPLAFDIRYREDDLELAPVVREHSTADSGLFEARADRVYCLTWDAGPAGAILGYRIVLRDPLR
jgi:hypothetical protein